MRRLLVLLIALFSYNSYAWNDQATDGVKRALLAIPTVKKARRKLENEAFKYALQSGLNREQITTTLAVIKSAAQGEITTKDIKIRMRMLGGEIKPVVKYNWRTNAALATIGFSWKW